VIAEKFQAMIDLGRANSRMKDYYDIWLLAKSFRFEDDRLARAIAATFARRMTPIPVELPDALTPEFALDPSKIRQWEAFTKNLEIDSGALDAIVVELAEFLMPHAGRARSIIKS